VRIFLGEKRDDPGAFQTFQKFVGRVGKTSIFDKAEFLFHDSFPREWTIRHSRVNRRNDRAPGDVIGPELSGPCDVGSFAGPQLRPSFPERGTLNPPPLAKPPRLPTADSHFPARHAPRPALIPHPRL